MISIISNIAKVKNYNLNVTEVRDPAFSRNFQFHGLDPNPHQKKYESFYERNQSHSVKNNFIDYIGSRRSRVP